MTKQLSGPWPIHQTPDSIQTAFQDMIHGSTIKCGPTFQKWSFASLVLKAKGSKMDYQFRIDQIKKAIHKKGYQWLDDGKPFHLNIIGIRANDARPNKFDDVIILIYNDGTADKIHQYKATTDPGLFYLLNPINVKGTAIVMAGQYQDCWIRGLHQGKYAALVQSGAKYPMKVIRDNNKDSRLDFDGKLFETGYFGINLHRANSKMESIQVDKWSAGCQVLSNPLSFAKLMDLVNKSIQHRPNSFSYTLLNQADVLSN